VVLKRKPSFTIAALVGLATVFIAAGIYAGTEVPDVITMQNKAYEKHTKGIVEFTHKKHVEEYKAACGDCHHDDKGQPLTDLQMGDNVDPCITCHKIPGTVPGELKKEWRETKMPKAEQKKRELEYHAEALHQNCITCHKDFNKKNNTKAAPVTCTTCHPKQG
jgi:hypothetical protein